MDPTLAEALEHPHMVVAGGPKPAKDRPSIKRAKGLRHFGAALMLGAALLSPFHAASAQTASVMEQRVEQVVQAEASAGSAYMQEASTSRVVERETQASKSEAQAERKPSYSSWSPRSDDYKPDMDHVHKDLKKGKEVAQWRWDYHSNKMLTDAYQEISAGHSVENPSGRLLDICRQVQKVNQEMPGFNNHQHADIVFKTCNAEGMAKEIRVDSIKKFAVLTPVLGGLLAVKGIASMAQLGSGVYLAGMLSGSSMADRRRQRDELKGSEAVATQTGPKPPTPG